MIHEVTVCIATIPPRRDLLARAYQSAATQTLSPAKIVVERDRERTGAAATKNRALARVDTEWTCFLDDDDWLFPNHLQVLADVQAVSGADVVYSSPVHTGGVVLPGWLPDAVFDPVALREANYIPTTSLVRTELAKSVGGFECPEGTVFDDWGLYLKLLDAGASFYHVGVHTWVYNWHGSNTSGVAQNW